MHDTGASPTVAAAGVDAYNALRHAAGGQVGS
jgi:hypothetical protein